MPLPGPNDDAHIPLESVVPSPPTNRTGKSFFVPVEEIRANKYDLSISRYKEIVHEEIQYEKPDVIMEKVLELEKDIAKEIREIKEML